MEDLYSLLGVSRKATPEEIEIAYRKKSLECHPDREGGDADTFKMVKKAYEILSSPEKKARYDKHKIDSDDLDEVELAVQSMVHEAFLKSDPISWMEQTVDGRRSQVKNRLSMVRAHIKKLKKNKDSFELFRSKEESEVQKFFILRVLNSEISELEFQEELLVESVKTGDEILAYLSGLRPVRLTSWPPPSYFDRMR